MGNRHGKYQGDVKNGKREGWGICAFKDRSYYEGEWVADQMDGKGIYVKADGSRYEGYWQANLQNGFGRLSLANGDVYEGDFRDGKMDGYGTYFYKNGSIYDGEFIEDEAHGLGTFKGVNGEFYQGEWQVDKMHGVGVYRFVGGAKFRGEWKFGKMDGYGIYENIENDAFMGKFEGQFLDGKMDGLGLYYWSEGDMYMGEYAQDKRHGSGIYTSVKGAVYKGEYISGERQGWGEYTNAKGDVYEGQWKRNVRHGKGVVTLAEADSDMAHVLEDGGADQRKWAQVWFKDSPARPQDTDGAELEIDPTRTFSGVWQKGKVKTRRPYRFEDWNNIQAHSSMAADNASVSVEESQRAVNMARKSAGFAEETAKATVSKMQAEAERKDAYFVHVAEGVDRRALEDKHMVRFGPEVTRDTLLVMVGPIKAAELRANNAEVAWLTHVASALNEMSMEKDTLMSPAVVAWIKKAERRMRRDVNWHVTKPEEHKAHVQTVFGTMSLKPGSKEFGVRGVEELEKKLEEGRRKRQEHDVINVSNMKLREAMKEIRDAGVTSVVKKQPANMSRAPVPPPKSQQQQYTTPRKFIGEGGGAQKVGNRPPLAPLFEEKADLGGSKADSYPSKPPPPAPPSHPSTAPSSRASSVTSSAPSSVASRYSRYDSPTWAGGAPMPPPNSVLARMAQQQRQAAKDNEKKF